MVTLSFKKHDIIVIAEALRYLGTKVKQQTTAITLIEILKKFKKAEKQRYIKDVYNMAIISIQKFNDLPTSSYKKSKMVP